MKKHIMKSSAAALMVALLIMASLPFFAMAKSTQAQQGNTSNGNSNVNSSDNSNGSSNSNTSKTTTPAQKKLGGDQLKNCQNREGAINNIMARISDRAQKQLTLMNSISTQVQNLYKNNNMSLGSYDVLVAAVKSKKTIAEKEMNNVRVQSRVFNCGGDDPKGIATQFKSEASTQAGALNEYKTSINNLLVGVESATVSSDGTE